MATSFRVPAGPRTARSAPSAEACTVCGQHALSAVNPDRSYPHPLTDGRLFCLSCGAHSVPQEAGGEATAAPDRPVSARA